MVLNSRRLLFEVFQMELGSLSRICSVEANGCHRKRRDQTELEPQATILEKMARGGRKSLGFGQRLVLGSDDAVSVQTHQ